MLLFMELWLKNRTENFVKCMRDAYVAFHGTVAEKHCCSVLPIYLIFVHFILINDSVTFSTYLEWRTRNCVLLQLEHFKGRWQHC
jgi:hypothetical protein